MRAQATPASGRARAEPGVLEPHGGAPAGPAPAGAGEAGGDRPSVIADGVRIVAWLSITAGLIHALAMVDHFAHYWLYGVFFLGLTYTQVLWGAGILRRAPTARVLRIGAWANLALVALWLLTRTVGVPFGPEAGDPEPIGSMDIAAVVVELALVAYVGVILVARLRTRRGLRALLGAHRVRIGIALCSACFFAALLGGGHTH